jgi:hypothetical protein
MIKKVKTSELRPNMFIHDLNCGWLDHPFLRNKFKLKSEQEIEKIIAYGIKDVYEAVRTASYLMKYPHAGKLIRFKSLRAPGIAMFNAERKILRIGKLK